MRTGSAFQCPAGPAGLNKWIRKALIKGECLPEIDARINLFHRK